MCHCGQSSFSSPQIFVQEMNLNFASAIACRHAEEHQKQKKNSSITRRKSRDNWVTSLWILRRLSLCLRAANPVPMFSGMGLRIPSIKRETSVFHFPVMPSACTRWGTMWRLNTMDCVIDGCGNWTSYFLFLTLGFLVCKWRDSSSYLGNFVLRPKWEAFFKQLLYKYILSSRCLRVIHPY